MGQFTQRRAQQARDRRVAEAKERGRALKAYAGWTHHNDERGEYCSRPLPPVTPLHPAARHSRVALLRRYAGVAAWTLMIAIGLWMAAWAVLHSAVP
jgi:hypothetical protein